MSFSSGRILNWVRQPNDIRDILYRSYRREVFDVKYSLRYLQPNIWDQGQSGSCVAHATNRCLLSSMIYKAKTSIAKANEPGGMLSRAMTYYIARYYSNSTNYDNGCFIRDALKALNKYGACSEQLLPYVPKDFSKKIPWYCYWSTIGSIKEYQKVEISVEAIKVALSNNNCVVAGFDVFNSIFSKEVEKTGIIPLPDLNEQKIGGHAIVYTGWNDEKRQLEFANSWSSEWGDKGYGYMPYAYINPKWQGDMYICS